MADVEVEVAGSVTQGAKASEPAQVSLEVQAKAQADTDADALARARIAEACRAASSAGEQSPSRGASATTGAPGSPESDLHAVEAP